MASQVPEIRWVKPRQSRSQETMDRICIAAEGLLNEKPFQQISVEEIAVAAGSSVGGFYARFKDKDALFDLLYDRYVAELRETVNEMFAPDRWQGVPLADRIHEFSKFAFSVIRSHRGLFRAMLLRRPVTSDIPCTEQDRERHKIIDGIRDLMLDCIDEMTHPDPELATRIGFFSLVASIHEKVLFADSAQSQSFNTTDDVLARELSLAFLAYVGATTRPSKNTTHASPTEGATPC